MSISSGSQGTKTDEEIWRRLNELEKEEKAKMDEDNNSEETVVDKRTDVPLSQPKKTNVAAQRIDHSKKEESFRESGHGGPLKIAVKHTIPVKKEQTSATEVCIFISIEKVVHQLSRQN